MNTNVKCGLWVITMCQCRFTDCDTNVPPWCRVLMGWQQVMHLCCRGTWQTSVPSAQSCCEPKTALYYFFKDFTYLFLEKGEGREKEGERNIICLSHAS